MANLIFNAFAFKEGYSSAPNLKSYNLESSIEIYLKNIFVSLKSAKLQNPEDDVALITNHNLPVFYQELFSHNNILIIICDFDNFVLPKNFKWSLAFYKLCALKFVLNNSEYDNFLLLDTDTVTIYPLDNLWSEAESGIMLYNTKHTYSHKVRSEMISVYSEIFKRKGNIQHYGGEFICGNKKDLELFINNCNEVFVIIENNLQNISDAIGDELIISIAAYGMTNIINGGAYIDRYWTGKFYLVSTNYKYDPVSIWHLPGEKDTGILIIYNYLVKHNKLPTNLHRIVGLPDTKRPYYLFYVYKKVIKRIKSKLLARK